MPDPHATLSLAAAEGTPWQAVVVGAGPAGSALATRLAARGLRTLLVDAAAMPRPKLCGCCLSPAAVAELALLAELSAAVSGGEPAASKPGSLPGSGPAAGLPSVAIPLRQARLVTPGVTAVVPLVGGGVVSREALDPAGVRQAVAAGAAWLPAARVMRIVQATKSTSGPLTIQFQPQSHVASPDLAAGPSVASGTMSLAAELVVLASGLADTIRLPDDPAAASILPTSRLGLGTTVGELPLDPPAGELVMAVGRGGYCGLVRLEDGRLDVAAAIDRGALAAAGSPAEAVRGVLADAGIDAAWLESLRERFAAAAFRGTPPLTRSRAVSAAAGRVLRIGDAAGYVEPFTGEGMGWALASARLCDESLAPAIAGGTIRGDLPAAAARYAAAHHRHFALTHARCRRVARAVRQPWLVGGAAWLARLAPGMAARVTPLVVGGPAQAIPKARADQAGDCRSRATWASEARA